MLGLAASRLPRSVIVGEAGFTGLGQGRTPRQWSERVQSGRFSWMCAAAPDEVADLCRDLSLLPDQDTPRPDPLYQLIARS